MVSNYFLCREMVSPKQTKTNKWPLRNLCLKYLYFLVAIMFRLVSFPQWASRYFKTTFEEVFFFFDESVNQTKYDMPYSNYTSS